MATASQNPTDPLAVAAWSDDGVVESKSERYLAKRLKAAGADYKGVAVTTFLLAAAVGAMLWLGSGVVVEHWFVPGGLPAWARWSWLAVGLMAFVAAAVRWMLPLVRYRVNLVYAARVIEREHPELHNDVVNAVLARSRSDEATPLIVKSLRRRAARQLSTVSADGVIDRTPALRLAYVLAGLIVVAGLYEITAPKSLLISAARLMAPWLGIMAPSRVRIEAPVMSWRMPGGPPAADATQQSLPIVNGVVTLVRGRQLVVSSGIRGLGAGEQPVLLVTSLRDDGAAEPTAAAWRVPMQTAGAKLHTAVLPDADRSLDHPVEIVIAAGDARSERIRVAVVDAPSLLVREVRYHYPDYTRQADETVPWQGDLRGLEGTKVTVVAESNHPLEAAWIDLGSDGKRDVPLAVAPQDLARARGTFMLQLNAERSAADHASYRLLFQPKASSLARREPAVADKMEYRIEVIPDLAPEVSIEEPTDKVVRVPPDAPVTIRVRAVDPDFGLTSVSVETRLQPGGEKPGRELLVGRRKVWRGAATLIPAELGAGPGQVLEYRAVAKDNRPEVANVTVTGWQKLKIDASAPPRQPPPEPAREGNEELNDEAAEDHAEEEGQQSKDGQGSKDGQESEDGRGPKDGQGSREQESGAGGGGQGERDAGQDQSEPQAGGQQPSGKSGDSGREGDEQEKSQQQPDPKQGGKQGEPQEGEEQGGGEGAKSNDGAEGKAGNQPGQQQQQGSRDGAGNKPQGQGGTDGQGGGQAGNQKDGGQGGQQKPSGPGQQEGGGAGEMKPGTGGQGDQPGAGRQQNDQRTGAGTNEQGDGTKPGGSGKGGSQSRGKPEPQGTVAADGTDDGEAMERILQHREQTKPGGQSKPGEQSSAGDLSSASEQSSAGEQGPQPKPAGQGQQTDPSGDGKAKGRDGNPGSEAGDPSQRPGAEAGKPDGGDGDGKASDQQRGNQSREVDNGKQGQQGEGQKGEGQKGEGQKGEGQKGECQK
ncbi:MAG: hypothetical protein ACR2IT_04090, partial [Pirellulales bacterium]